MGDGGRPSLLQRADTPSDWECAPVFIGNSLTGGGGLGTKGLLISCDPRDESLQTHAPRSIPAGNKALNICCCFFFLKGLLKSQGGKTPLER